MTINTYAYDDGVDLGGSLILRSAALKQTVNQTGD